MHDEKCLFCRLILGKEKGWIVFEDKHHVAFLTPFPNTPGFTVLATREHLPSYVLELPEERFIQLVSTAKKLGQILDDKLGTRRTGIVMEGMGIDHAHVKLIPMHGIPTGEWKPMLGSHTEFTEIYQGYLSTLDGPRMTETDLDRIQTLITKA